MKSFISIVLQNSRRPSLGIWHWTSQKGINISSSWYYTVSSHLKPCHCALALDSLILDLNRSPWSRFHTVWIWSVSRCFVKVQGRVVENYHSLLESSRIFTNYALVNCETKYNYLLCLFCIGIFITNIQSCTKFNEPCLRAVCGFSITTLHSCLATHKKWKIFMSL